MVHLWCMRGATVQLAACLFPPYLAPPLISPPKACTPLPSPPLYPQGLCLFNMFGCFTAVTGPLFGAGILLACCTVALMAAARRPTGASERGLAPLMEDAAPVAALDVDPSSTDDTNPYLWVNVAAARDAELEA